MILTNELESKRRITKNELLTLIKKEAALININKIMLATAFLRMDAKYMQSPYREDYIERFSKAFFARIKNVKDDETNYKGYVNINKLREFLETLNKQLEEADNHAEQCFFNIAGIIAIYTTFIREESIHPIGTKFPGGLALKYNHGKYYCPVKEKQLKNPSALCRFCVSIQDERL
jgi:uncharacterized protein (UPF0305 family)